MISIKYKLLFCIFLLLSLSSISFVEAKSKETPENVSPLASPTLDVSTGFLGSGIELVADSDKSSASISFLRKDEKVTKKGINFKNNYGLNISAPLNKSTDIADYITDNGIVSNVSLQVSYSGISFEALSLPLDQEGREKILTRLRQACIEDPGLIDKSVCKNASMKTLKKYLTEEEKLALKDSFERTKIYLYGFSGTIGYESYDFRNIDDFSEQESSETSYSFSAYFGVSPNSLPIYLGLGYQYKKQYIDADEQTLCQGSSGNIQECFTDSFEGPAENTDSTLFGVFRFQYPVKISTNQELDIGIEVKAAYDFEDEVFGINVPLYFLKGEDSNLRGGVRVNWQDDDDEFNYGVFVSGSFSVFQ